jgi:hypothetical protein
MVARPFRIALQGMALCLSIVFATPAVAQFSFLEKIGIGKSESKEEQPAGQAEAPKDGQPAEQAEAPKDLLSNLELGEQLRQKRQFAESRKAWLVADEYVRAWEDEVKNSPEKVLQALGEGLGSLLINDTFRRYDGSDYERVALATRLALGHLALGDWEKSRTEIRKMHEREAIIVEFRAKEVEALKAEREEKKVETKEIKDLDGYPVETLDSPEITGLRNSYQSAFGHYLAGFLYEQAGESSLAAAGYRQAIELRPDVPMLQNALSGLDKRMSGTVSSQATDTLLILEAGQIPKKTSTTIPLPIPTHRGLVIVPTSFPSLPAPAPNPMPATVNINGKPVGVAVVTSYDSMARRELKDSMPGVITRGTIRSIAKGIINSEVSSRAGIFGGLISAVLTTVSEKADDRMWGSLPSHVALVRTTLVPGKHTIEMGGVTSEFEVMGAHSLVALRLNNPGDLLVSAATTPKIEMAQAAEEPIPTPALATAKKGTKKPANKEKTK